MVTRYIQVGKSHPGDLLVAGREYKVYGYGVSASSSWLLIEIDPDLMRPHLVDFELLSIPPGQFPPYFRLRTLELGGEALSLLAPPELLDPAFWAGLDDGSPGSEEIWRAAREKVDRFDRFLAAYRDLRSKKG